MARGDRRRGVPHRRHLRHPRLRAQETAGLRQPFRRRFRRRGGLRLARRRDQFRLASDGRGQGKRDHPAIGDLPQPISKRPASSCRGTRRDRRPAKSAAWRAGASSAPDIFSSPRAARPRCDPAVPGLEHAISSNEIFDLADFSQSPAGRRRRLYRGGVRLVVRAARRRA